MEALIRIMQYEGVLTAGGDLYGCSTGLGSKGEEEEEEEVVGEKEEEASGALPPAAALLSLRVRHCSLSHQMPTCPHTLAPVRVLRLGTHTHASTHLRSRCVLTLFQYVFGPSGLLSGFHRLL